MTLTAPSPTNKNPTMTALMNNHAIEWSDPNRAQAFANWLAQQAPAHQLQTASLRLASSDASFRRYFRVGTSGPVPGTSCIIMDAPPDKEDCAAFAKVAGLMHDAGLCAPRVLAWDEAQGFMLLTDLGAQTMMELMNPPASVAAIAAPSVADEVLYAQATDALVQWQLASRPGVLPLFDDALLGRELALFPDWYVAKHRALVLTPAQQATLNSAFELIKASNLLSLEGARVFVHRDFMARNLMVANGKLGVLDFQDAVYGPITYDIASLMRDAFLTWEEDFVLYITVRYWQKARAAGLPVGRDFGEFYRAVEWMGLQRHIKILGIFARLTLRDSKSKYLADTPRFIKYVRATCARYRQLGPLMVLLDQIEGNETRVGYTF